MPTMNKRGGDRSEVLLTRSGMVLLCLYAIFLFLSIGASAHGADIMWLPFSLLAVIASAIQWIENSRRVRLVGFVLVTFAIALAIGDVLAMQARQLKLAAASARAAYLQGECKGAMGVLEGGGVSKFDNR